MIERIYTIPLRKKCVKTQEHRRGKKAISVVKQFLTRHMKSKDVSIGMDVNETIWSKGIRNIPGKVKVKVTKDDNGKVKASIEK
jgi:large subunit ribosomal protein L31e